MVENEYSKVKKNNEMDYCSVTDMDVKAALEKAFMKARVSYFLRWEKPGFFARLSQVLRLILYSASILHSWRQQKRS